MSDSILRSEGESDQRLFGFPTGIRGQLALETDAGPVGRRHVREDGRGCNCGCARVVGLAGEVIETCAELDLAIVRFSVPCPAGGAARSVSVAYTLTEAGVRS